MREDLPTMILLNTPSAIVQLESMEEELLSQVILSPISSTILLQELMRTPTINTKILKYPRT